MPAARSKETQSSMPAGSPADRPLPPPSEELEEIFQAYHGKIFGAAYRITGNAQDAEDVLQTVFLRLLRRQDQLDLDPQPGAYLHRAAVNAALDLMRSRSRKRSIPLDDLDAAPDASRVDDPEQRQQDRDVRRGLRQAMLGLSERAAEIFALRFFEGVSNQDIATSYGMTQSAVGVALHRARNHVKKEIRSFAGDS
ncbi:MAG: sigma-70 family RNA polymerase sigma factor [Acidobacteriota bacterium]